MSQQNTGAQERVPATQRPAVSTTAPGSLPAEALRDRAGAQRWQLRHDNETDPLGPAPGQAVEVRASSGERLPVGRASIFFTVDGSKPAIDSAAVPMRRAAVDWDRDAGFLTRWLGILPAQPAGTIVRYRIGAWRHAGAGSTAEPDWWAQDGQGFWYKHAGDAGITTFAYRVETGEEACPDWARDAVIYQIFLDRFHPGTTDGAFADKAGPHALHGGTLEGVRRALPYLEDLGITCIWLSPFCASPSYHRYDAADLYTVDPNLGTNEDMRRLTGDAHARGMRVMMDFVPAHCSRLHPAFVEAQKDRSAATASWFYFTEWPRGYRCFLDRSPSLPSFNGDDEGARRYLIHNALYWAGDYGVDAFRLDHAIGLSMDFWVAFRDATRSARPDIFTVGEATDTPDSLRRYRGRLDAILDFPLAAMLRETFSGPAGDVAALDGFLTAYLQYLAGGPAGVGFLDNHDMNRFLFLANGDVERLKVAALCLFTLPATPVIYYGTEIALPQLHDIAAPGSTGDAEVRTDMPWSRDRWNLGVHASFRDLVALRRRSEALRRGAWQSAYVGEETRTYVYRRTIVGDPRAEMLIAFNIGDRRSAAPLGTAGPYRVVYATRDAAAVRLDQAAGSVTLPPVCGAVLSAATIS